MSGTENKKPVIGFGFNLPFGEEEQTLHLRYHGDTNGMPRVKGRDELVATIAAVISRNFDPSCRLGVVVSKEDWSIRCNVDFYQHDDRISGYVFIFDGFGEYERRELERGSSVIIDALRHWHPDVIFVNCVDEVTAETGKGAFFAINGEPKTAIASEPAPNGIPAEIDRLRERIRILEQDVERAMSSIAELSVGGGVPRAGGGAVPGSGQINFGGGGAVEVPEGYSYRLCVPDLLTDLRAFFTMMAEKCDTPLELQFRDAIRAKLYRGI